VVVKLETLPSLALPDGLEDFHRPWQGVLAAHTQSFTLFMTEYDQVHRTK
jgi:hypothetical protein